MMDELIVRFRRVLEAGVDTSEMESLRYFPVIVYLDRKWRESVILGCRGEKVVVATLGSGYNQSGLPGVKGLEVATTAVLPLLQCSRETGRFLITLWWFGMLSEITNEESLSFPKEYVETYGGWSRRFQEGTNYLAAMEKRSNQEGGVWIKRVLEVFSGEEVSIRPAIMAEEGGLNRPILYLGKELGGFRRVDKTLKYRVLVPGDPVSVQVVFGEKIWPTKDEGVVSAMVCSVWLSVIARVALVYEMIGLTLAEAAGSGFGTLLLEELRENKKQWQRGYLEGVMRPENQYSYLEPAAWGFSGSKE